MTTVDLPAAPFGPRGAPPVLDTPEERDALACPLCRYPFRGLSTIDRPQCPECGYRFEWVELLRARQHNHPYLFEHHRGRGVRSFVRTFVQGLTPRRFWSSLNAGHEVRPRRVVGYWVVVALVILLAGSVGSFAVQALTLYQQRVQFLVFTRFAGGRSPPQTAISQILLAAARTTFDHGSIDPYLLAAAAAWPWMTLGALLVFQASMRAARVRTAHVLRCTVYCGDVFVWAGVALLALAGLRWFGIISANRMWDSTLAARQTAFSFLLLQAVATYRLGVAYRRYLRFDRPWATVVASQVVVLLAIITTLSLVYAQFWKLLPPY